MGKLIVDSIVLGMCQTNTYFLHLEGSTNTIIVDPADEGTKIHNYLKKNGLKPVGIILTHGHFDHILGVKDLVQATEKDEGVKLLVHACEKEKNVLNDARMNLSGSFCSPYTIDADVYLKDGEVFSIADMTFRVIWTPGHTEGSCCFYFENEGVLITGDTLFARSVGRSDFPTGDGRTLCRSIREKLFVLPEETMCYPGHMQPTNIGLEKKYNPCV